MVCGGSSLTAASGPVMGNDVGFVVGELAWTVIADQFVSHVREGVVVAVGPKVIVIDDGITPMLRVIQDAPRHARPGPFPRRPGESPISEGARAEKILRRAEDLKRLEREAEEFGMQLVPMDVRSTRHP